MTAEPRNMTDPRALVPAATLAPAAWAVAFAVLTALAAQIRVPLGFTPVPFTLQVFTVLLAGYVLGSRPALASMLLYLGLGVAGAPVFSGGAAGGALTGPTAGYLLAFPAAAWTVSRFAAGRGSITARLSAGVAGLALIHLGGFLWLAFVFPLAPRDTGALLTWSLLPFLGADLVKMLVAERLGRALTSRRPGPRARLDPATGRGR